jgi:hypothetical protein
MLGQPPSQLVFEEGADLAQLYASSWACQLQLTFFNVHPREVFVDPDHRVVSLRPSANVAMDRCIATRLPLPTSVPVFRHADGRRPTACVAQPQVW